MRVRKDVFQDTLYGSASLSDELTALAKQPEIQRLRHVRQSNIDSLDIPGIANLSRYEHALGTAYLTLHTGLWPKLSRVEQLVLGASALMHDWAITSFGHLVEEALQYVGSGFDHEERLSEIAADQTPEELLGIGKQILVGRQIGLRHWTANVAPEDSGRHLLSEITQHIRGKGQFGRLISGDIDLDNIDNVFRMAHHMGLRFDRDTPPRLASQIIDYDRKNGNPIFMRTAERDIDSWRSIRSAVYQYLMLAPRDFAGKVMLLFATIRSYESGEIQKVDWHLTDYELIHRLLSSRSSDAKEATAKWIAGELWNLTPLVWMSGERPSYPDILGLSRRIDDSLGRKSLAYGIKDKRDRRLTVQYDDGTTNSFGRNPSQWLLGVGSSGRPFTHAETKTILDLARESLNTEVVSSAEAEETEPSFL